MTKHSKAQPENEASPTITVLRERRVSAAKPKGGDAQAADLHDALDFKWDTDAHFCAYEPSDPPVRLAGDPANVPGGVRMVALIGDLDDPIAHRDKTPARLEWREEQLDRIFASDLAHYETRGGYRVLATLAEPFVLTSKAHADEWKARYVAWCDEVEQSCGLLLDRKCKDWTRLYRLPNVERDGETQASEVLGDLPVVALPAAGASTSTGAKSPKHASADDVARARARVIAEELPASVEGLGGDDALFKAANEIATQLGDDADAIEAVLSETFNPRCVPPWAAAKLKREAQRAAERQAPVARFARRRAQADAEREAKKQAESDAKREAEAHPAASNAPSVPRILRSKKKPVLTLLWEGDELGHRPLAETNLRLRIRELGYHNGLIPLKDAKSNKPLPPDRLVEEHGATYVHTAYAFANRVTTYDPTGEGSVTIGYPLDVMPGKFDADADAWLRALAGAHYDRLAVWIASCSQVNINRLSACLIVMGRADSGKSMLGHAVARMWKQAPPPLSLITVQFNADLLRCPILVDEEAQLLGSKKLSTKEFRDVIQSVGRSVEHKGLERCELHGALRAVVSCNGYSDLRFADLGGPAVIEALRDRMLVINATERTDACKALLAPLRLPNDHRVDLDRVARHLAWICETVALPVERFLGAGGDESEAAILSSQTEEDVELWETFRDWLEAEVPGGAWSAHRGELCAEPKALAVALERAGKGWALPRVRTALAPFKVRDYQPDGPPRPRLWVVDGPRIADALGLDTEARAALTAELSASAPPAQPRKAGRFAIVR